MMKNTFDYENEISFLVSKEKYISLFKDTVGIPPVHCFRCVQIQQAWLENNNINNVIKRTRIRIWKEIGKSGEDIGNTHYEYTTKYYFPKNRIEINSNLDRGEYILLTGVVHKNLDYEHKKRFFLEDTETGIVYTADVFNDNTKKVRIEVEFNNEKERDNFVVPKWLNNILEGK